MFHPVSPLFSLFGRPFLSVVFCFVVLGCVLCLCCFEWLPTLSRCRSFLPDLMTVRAVMVRAALEKKQQKNALVLSLSTPHHRCTWRRGPGTPLHKPGRRPPTSTPLAEPRRRPVPPLPFFWLGAAGQVPGGAPFSQRSELATACTNRMQIKN